MAFFEDLTPYSYFPTGEVDDFDTVNIGWLDSKQPFLIGKTSEEFQLRLATLCSRKVNQTRGFKNCPVWLGLCPKWKKTGGKVKSSRTRKGRTGRVGPSPWRRGQSNRCAPKWMASIGHNDGLLLTAR